MGKFPLSSFWSLAVYKNGRGRPGPLYHMNDICVYLGRQKLGGGGGGGVIIEIIS